MTNPKPLTVLEIEQLADTYEISERAAERMRPVLQERDALRAELEDMRRAWAILDEPGELGRMEPLASEAAAAFRRKLSRVTAERVALESALESARAEVAQLRELVLTAHDAARPDGSMTPAWVNAKNAALSSAPDSWLKAKLDETRRESLEDMARRFEAVPDSGRLGAARACREVAALATTPPTAQGERHE